MTDLSRYANLRDGGNLPAQPGLIHYWLIWTLPACLLIWAGLTGVMAW